MDVTVRCRPRRSAPGDLFPADDLYGCGSTAGAGPVPAASQHRVLGVTYGVHALHDGYTDLIYVLLPIWQTEFALSYAALGALRMLYTGAMAGLQVPATVLARRFGAVTVLTLGTCLAAGAYLTIGITGAGFVVLAAALLAGGAGSSTQHPLASALIARAYDGPRGRSALGTYNFAGDLGKMALPATVAWLLVVMPWRHALGLIGVLGLAVAAGILLLLPRSTGRTVAPVTTSRRRCPAVPLRRARAHLAAAGDWCPGADAMGSSRFCLSCCMARARRRQRSGWR